MTHAFPTRASSDLGHVSNTALQLQMFAALGGAPPAFAHEALLTCSEGKLSKRLGSLGVDAFREAGIEPEAVRALLARIGTSAPVAPLADAGALIESFDVARFGRAPARFAERSDARHVGTGWVWKCRTRGWRENSKKN